MILDTKTRILEPPKLRRQPFGSDFDPKANFRTPSRSFFVQNDHFGFLGDLHGVILGAKSDPKEPKWTQMIPRERFDLPKRSRNDVLGAILGSENGFVGGPGVPNLLILMIYRVLKIKLLAVRRTRKTYQWLMCYLIIRVAWPCPPAKWL